MDPISSLKCAAFENDDESSIENAWPGIVTTFILYGTVSLFFIMIFECCRGANPMVYSPRNEITPDRKALKMPGGFYWVGTLLQIDDDETLRVAGMDAYTLVRFLRFNLILSSFCFLFTFIILVPIYGSSNYDSANSFSAATMDNLRPGSGRLWACWVSAYVITGVTLYNTRVEWLNHIIKRTFFFKNGDSSIPGGQQFLYTVGVNSLPMELCSEFKLTQYFKDQLFPASSDGSEVVSCIVHLNKLTELKKLIDKSESTVVKLETAIAQRNKLHRDREAERNVPQEDDEACHETTTLASAADSKLEPRTAYCCVCIPGRGQLVGDDEEVVASGALCCSKAVNSIPHLSNLLKEENEKVESLQTAIMRASENVESSARSGITEKGKQIKSGSGFVTLRSRQAVSVLSQVLLSNSPLSVEVSQAPDPRDVIWDNANGDMRSIRYRQSMVSIIVKFFGLFLFIPLLVLCNLFGDIERLSNIPGLGALKELDPDSFVYNFITTQVPPLLQATIVGLLPTIFTAVAIHIEGVQTYSAVQRSVLDRAFGYQLVNVYFTLLGASLGSTLKTIIDKPACIFTLLGSAIPAVAGYFSQIVLINGLMGMGLELSRLVPLIVDKLLAFLDKKGVSIRAQQERFKPKGDGKDYISIFPGELYPGILFVTILGLTYAIIVPFMSAATTLFFLLAFVVYKHNVLYVYCPVFESGGDLFAKIHGYVLTGLNFGNTTLVAYFIIKEGFLQVLFMLPLFVVVEMFRKHTTANYLPCVQGISREGAVKIDAQFTSRLQPSDSFEDSLFRQPELNHSKLLPLNEDTTTVTSEVEIVHTTHDASLGAGNARVV